MPLNRIEMRDYMQRYKDKRRKEAYEYLGGTCANCGSTRDLEIDHIDPSTKSFHIAENWTRAKSEIYDELSKCQLLCAACHLERTRSQNLQNVSCGTVIMYRRGCKCEKCKKAWREYKKQP